MDMTDQMLCAPDDTWVCKNCTLKNTNDVVSCVCCGVRKKRDSVKKKTVEASRHCKFFYFKKRLWKRETTKSKATAKKPQKIKRTARKQRRNWQVIYI